MSDFMILSTIIFVKFILSIKNSVIIIIIYRGDFLKTKNYIWAFFIIGILGTLSHFTYEWLGKNFIVGLFFSVNESTWEHLKLLFYPTIIYTVGEYLICRPKEKTYIPASVLSLYCGMLSIVVLFYTYSGVLGRNVDFINIAIFYIGVIITLITKAKLLKSSFLEDDFLNVILLLSLVLIGVFFAVFTYNPPSLGIFLPPINT